MNSVKVYDADGKLKESFKRPKIYPIHIPKEKTDGKSEVVLHNWNHMIWYLNQCGFWIKGQVTNKGVRIS